MIHELHAFVCNDMSLQNNEENIKKKKKKE